jgi:precorrin-6B methylase 2
VERKDALKRTSSIAEIIMKSISMIHRTEKAIRISIGAGSNSVSTVGKWGMESASAMDRKKEARTVTGRKKRKHG